MATVDDAKLTNLRAKLVRTTGSIADNEYAFFSANSGLPAKRSLNDHKKAYFILKGGTSINLTTLEIAFMKAQGAVGTDADSIFTDFYRNHVYL